MIQHHSSVCRCGIADLIVLEAPCVAGVIGEGGGVVGEREKVIEESRDLGEGRLGKKS